MYEEHLKSCEYCQKGSMNYSKVHGHKPTISVKSASSYNKQKKLSELAAIIKGISYPSLEPIFQTKGASLARNTQKIDRDLA